MSVPANASNPASLFPHMTQQYDASLFRELVNNCIAHQEYTLGGRIYIDEFEHALIISNPGSFLPGDIREVLKPGYTAPYNRNQLLADAMVKFNMIDTETGIRNVFNIQRDRYFPMPDYDLSTPQKVAVTVHGRILDDSYTRQQFGSGKRADFVQLLNDRLSEALDDRQKGNRVRHFLATLQKNGLIERTTKNRRTGAWRLTKKE